MRLWRLLRAVLWSFIGVRRSADAARDLHGVRPHTIFAAAVIVVVALVIGIASLVQIIVGNRAGQPAAPEVPANTGVVASNLSPHGPAVLVDTMEERVRACTACHGSTTQPTRDGFSTRIAGKPAGYLFNQLTGFRDGRRTYAPMAYLVQYMSDDYLHEVSRYFSNLELPYAAPEPLTLPPEAIVRVRDLIERGDSARGIPACSACHGQTLSGTEPAIPGLLGLARDYMNAQFGGQWRTGKLRSIEPDCMAEIGRRLAPEDAAALAAWLASQPVPAGMKPQPRQDRPLPLECGSVLAASR